MTEYGELLRKYTDMFNQWSIEQPLHRAYLDLGVMSFLTLCILYFLFSSLRNYVSSKNSIYSFGVSFPIISHEEGVIKITEFLNSVHSLLAGCKLSLEVHKVGEDIQLLISSDHKKVLSHAQKYITGIEGVTIQQEVSDPIEYFKKHRFTLRSLTLRRNYFCMRPQADVFSHIIDYLSSLKKEEHCSLIIAMRYTNRKHSIRYLKHKWNLKLQQSPRNTIYTEYINDVEQKSIYPLFFTQIYVAGSSYNSQGVQSIIKGTSGRNSFKSNVITFGKYRRLKGRHVHSFGLLTQWVRSHFGSFLNSLEIAQLFHPSKIQRGRYKESKAQIIEASPAFLKDGKGKVLLGTSTQKTGEQKKVYLPTSNRRRHTYIVGTTGSGKSTLLIRNALSICEEGDVSLIFFDPHESDLKHIVKRLESWDNVVYFDFFNTEGTKKITFNPLFSFQTSITQKETLVEDILNIIESESKDRDLGVSIKKLLKFLLTTGVHFADAYYLYLQEELSMDPEEAKKKVFDKQLTLPDLAYILREEYGFRDLLETIFTNYTGSIQVRKWSTGLQGMQLSPMILDGIDNRLSNILNDSIAPMLSSNNFKLDELIAQKKQIFIPVSEQSLGFTSKKLLTKLLLTQIWSYAQRSYTSDEKEKAVLIIDEVQEAQTELLHRMLSESRKYGISLVLAHQYLNQLHPSLLNGILGNVANIFSFKMGNIKEAELIAPHFNKKVEPEDIVSLPPFTGYLKTLDDGTVKETALMSFETMDYRTEFEEIHSDEDLKKLSSDCLHRYGEDTETIMKRYSQKLEDVERWYL